MTTFMSDTSMDPEHLYGTIMLVTLMKTTETQQGRFMINIIYHKHRMIMGGR
jgi:hypothetical protein